MGTGHTTHTAVTAHGPPGLPIQNPSPEKRLQELQTGQQQ